jgi:hypothetical protein
MVRVFFIAALCLLSLFESAFAAGENDWFVPLGRPPDAPP